MPLWLTEQRLNFRLERSPRELLVLGEVKSFHAADALAVALTVFYRNYRGRNDILLGRDSKKDLR